MTYNHRHVSSKATIESLDSSETAFVKRRTSVIVFQFIIVIFILWQLLKHDRMIEKTILTTQYTNLYKICSELFYKNKTLTNENSMLMNLISFFWFCFVFFFMWTQIVWFICIKIMKWRRDVALSLFAEKVFYFEIWL